MGLGDQIFDSGLEDVILKNLVETKLFGFAYDDWIFDNKFADDDYFEGSESELCYNGYSVAFHTLWPMARTMLTSDAMPWMHDDEMMVKSYRLRVREKILSTIEDKVGKKFDRTRWTEEDLRAMARAAYDLADRSGKAKKWHDENDINKKRRDT